MDGLPALLQARGLKAVEELIACNNFTVRFGLFWRGAGAIVDGKAHGSAS
jgi:hypothetical protein